MANKLSEKWQERFNFFDSVGGDVTSAQYKQELKKLGFMKRLKIVYNFWAFFFGIIYFCILGLWKKGLVIFSSIVLLNIVVYIIEEAGHYNLDALYRGISIAGAVFSATTVNYAYYLKETKGKQSWNPLEGFFKKK